MKQKLSQKKTNALYGKSSRVSRTNTTNQSGKSISNRASGYYNQAE